MQEKIDFVAYALFVKFLAKPKADVVDELLHGVTGISKENGELTDNVYRAWNYGKPIDVTNIVEELGDIFFYMQIIMNHTGVGIEQVVSANVEKLSRRYPHGYSDAAALARADKDSSDSR